MPRGWRQVSSTTSPVTAEKTGCLAGLSTTSSPGARHVGVAFVEGAGLPSIIESIEHDVSAAGDYAKSVAALARCTGISFLLDKKTVHAQLSPLALPHFATASAAFTLRFNLVGLSIVDDLMLFRDGNDIGLLEFDDTVDPPLSAVESVANAAASKIAGQRVHLAALSVASVRERTAHTTDGDVGYRAFGLGPPLVLIMGYGGTMEVWDPRFVDALAERHRVIIFDNAGIGRTSALKHLTIDAMAQQASALITALDLGRPDVLGWSMGSMIAQALAVLHPTQVAKLVLCATYPGNGSTVPPSTKAINALNSGDSAKELADLFPAGQSGAEESYALAVGDFPSANVAPQAVVNAQAAAIRSWWAGTDLAGRTATAIAAPTLIADGSEDRLDPTVNDHLIARLLAGAKLVLYSDAGHAFLFQDEDAFVPLVLTFLG